MDGLILGFILGLFIGIFLMSGEVDRANKRVKEFEAAARTLWNK